MQTLRDALHEFGLTYPVSTKEERTTAINALEGTIKGLFSKRAKQALSNVTPTEALILSTPEQIQQFKESFSKWFETLLR